MPNNEHGAANAPDLPSSATESTWQGVGRVATVVLSTDCYFDRKFSCFIETGTDDPFVIATYNSPTVRGGEANYGAVFARAATHGGNHGVIITVPHDGAVAPIVISLVQRGALRYQTPARYESE